MLGAAAELFSLMGRLQIRRGLGESYSVVVVGRIQSKREGDLCASWANPHIKLPCISQKNSVTKQLCFVWDILIHPNKLDGQKQLTFVINLLRRAYGR